MNSEGGPIAAARRSGFAEVHRSPHQHPRSGKAEGIADMLLIFFSAGGTIVGVFLAAIVYLFFTASQGTPLPGCSSYW